MHRIIEIASPNTARLFPYLTEALKVLVLEGIHIRSRDVDGKAHLVLRLSGRGGWKVTLSADVIVPEALLICASAAAAGDAEAAIQFLGHIEDSLRCIAEPRV